MRPEVLPTFNLLDSRDAISVMGRVRSIKRVQRLARRRDEAYLKLRGQMGYPPLKAVTVSAHS